MEVSLTQSEELKSKLLNARDRRWRLIESLSCGKVLIVVSSNMPGINKRKADDLIFWAERQLKKNANAVTIETAQDEAGTAVFMYAPLTSGEAKKVAIELENEYDFCRLLDVDIYTNSETFGRKEAGLDPRQCLICGSNAFNCIRTGKHKYAEAVSAAEKLIELFHSYRS
jgi:holo-ACP synthase CitX